MARVLFVSKPLAPPWNDSSKNLARDVASGLSRHEPIVLGDGSGAWAPPRGRVEPIYRDAGRFAPGLGAQLRVLRRLSVGARADLWHFFFAPNAKSSTAARALSALRRTVTIQTVCSRPKRLERAERLLFADRTVVLSRATRDELVRAGVPQERLSLVVPAVPPLELPNEPMRAKARADFDLPRDAPLIVYPGDLELGEGAARMVEAFGRLGGDAVLAMACRPKTPDAKRAEDALRDRTRALDREHRTVWIGETACIHDLLAAADVVALPSSDLHAKMDLPLVLLEAMWLARPVLVASASPAAELCDGDAALAVDPDPEVLAEALRGLIDDAERRAALGDRARKAAEERFHPARMAREYEAIYDQLLGTHS